MSTWGSAWGLSWGASWGDDGASPPVSGGDRLRYALPRHLIDQQALRAIEEDDVLLLIIGALVAG